MQTRPRSGTPTVSKRLRMFTASCVGVLGSSLLIAPVVQAAPPVAVADDVSGVSAVAFDALGNDSDPDSDSLQITAVTQPTNGSASCEPNGGCLYSANAGFSGTDSFTYTVTAAGESSVGTVTVTIDQPVADPATVVATDDTLVTTTGVASGVDVLGNDIGTSLTVSGNTQPTNGSAVCVPSGLCTYTPTAGFSGFDGFTYTATNGQISRTATVLITVAQPASPTVTASGSPLAPNNTSGTSVAPGTNATWAVASKPPPGSSGDTPGLTADLTVAVIGNHSIIPGSLTLAPGWTSAPAGSSLTLTPGATATLGESRTVALPAPSAPISQGTGGDGFTPTLVGSRVFAIYHHTFNTSVTCIDRSTGELCVGYPIATNMISDNYNGPSAVVGTKFYTRLIAPNSSALGLFCWDTVTNQTCGYYVLDRNVPIAGSPTLLVAGKIWTMSSVNGLVYCLDPASGLACGPPADVGFPDSIDDPMTDAVSHANRIYYGSSSLSSVACLDVTTGARCAGWETPAAIPDPPHPAPGYPMNIVNRYTPTGVVDGVCVVSDTGSLCYSDAGGTGTPGAVWPNSTGPYFYSVGQEAETGTRTLYGALSVQGMTCWDWTTNALCAGGGWVGGELMVDTSGDPLPSSGLYGATFDGSCAVALGDNGLVYTVDPAGSSPCTSLGTGAAPQQVDLRSQRCDNTVGNATWRDVRVLGADLSAGVELTSLVVTVRDGQTNAVVATQEMVGTSGVLDLSGVSAATHPSLILDANTIATADSAAWDDGIPPRVQLNWSADPTTGCFQTAVPLVVCDGSESPLSITGTIGASAAMASLTAAAGQPCTTAPGATVPAPTVPTVPGNAAPVPIIPPTGSDSSIAGVAGLLLAAGFGLVMLARRRPRRII